MSQLLSTGLLELPRGHLVASQEELRHTLRRRGGGTLSRDIHELGLMKTAQGYATTWH